ncbi:MAG: nucleotide exchange factor GrpE [Bacteroidales bacterium]|nr:nucleotide exchange factor GrpE [Bacteroidales bacterium]
MEQEKNTEQIEKEQSMEEPVIEVYAEPEVEVEIDENTDSGDNNRKNRRRRSERHANELNAKVEEMGRKLVEMNDKYMRIYSEYENYRKRTNAEKAGLILNGGKDVIKLMLPVIDDMERALDNLADGDAAKEGMQLILKNMLNALQQKGLRPMEAKGAKFDENFHEAITQIPAPSPEFKGMVMDVVKKGYFLNDEVLRFAQVVVGC